MYYLLVSFWCNIHFEEIKECLVFVVAASYRGKWIYNGDAQQMSLSFSELFDTGPSWIYSYELNDCFLQVKDANLTYAAIRVSRLQLVNSLSKYA